VHARICVYVCVSEYYTYAGNSAKSSGGILQTTTHFLVIINRI
jgi:hypothetical protein